MDPVAILYAADQAISDGALDEVANYLADYWAWREREGFEPWLPVPQQRGDVFARECARRLSDAQRQAQHEERVTTKCPECLGLGYTEGPLKSGARPVLVCKRCRGSGRLKC